MGTVASILKLARAQGVTLGAVESLTGGMLLAALTSVSGASKVVKGGLVTYADEEKEKLLHVSKARLQKYGAISPEVAHDMAKMGRYRLNVDLCLALTGNAGPKALENKPIGLYYLALASAHEVQVSRFEATGTRVQIRRACVEQALVAIEKQLRQSHK
ncbi:MAG: CinA family protein [Bacilli bacterium]|jgi:PncC family amidohydrolase